MKILLAEKSKNLVSALMLLLTQIKNTDVKNIDLILNVDKVDNLYKELKKEKPDVLIMNGGFVDHKTRETVPLLQELYPLMTTLILGTDPELEKKYLEKGMDNFLLKGDSAEDFYISMVNFLNKEQKRFQNRSF
jgi:DNA-binding NarL/FixJ family response regulator